MQQLNLDWLLERMGRTPETIRMLALPQDFDLQNLVDTIDLYAEDIPKGFSFLQFGSLDDDKGRTAFVQCWKCDDDNLVLFILSLSANLGPVYIESKYEGTWDSL